MSGEVCGAGAAEQAGVRHSSAVLWLLLLVPGCLYGGVGPTIGIVNPELRPTLGWEVSALTVTAGQSFATSTGRDAARAYPWRSRSYLSWEPRIGIPSTEQTQRGVLFGGVGGTLGVRWDQALRSDAGGQLAPLIGVWSGGGYGFPRGDPSACSSDRTQEYFSFAVGVRDGEVYLAPKVGVARFPNNCDESRPFR